MSRSRRADNFFLCRWISWFDASAHKPLSHRPRLEVIGLVVMAATINSQAPILLFGPSPMLSLVIRGIIQNLIAVNRGSWVPVALPDMVVSLSGFGGIFRCVTISRRN